MVRYRYILAFIPCFFVEAGIYYGLSGVGAAYRVILMAEIVWLCATVCIVLSIGERFEPK
jgi:hypothetical protein